ncbi:MAG: 50S ribosomal protein L10 [archaeon]
MTVPEWKKEHVKEIKKMAEKPVVGIISLKGLPSKQFQEIKKELRGEADIKVSRRTLIKMAFEKANKKGIEKLEEYLEGPCGIIASEKNPFKLYKSLEDKKSKAKAKPGKKAEKEVIVPKGPTGLQPGPILSNLQQAGLSAQIKEGDIFIGKKTTLLEPGQEITTEIASALNTLDIKPLEIGIKPVAILEDDTIFTPEQLHIDIDKIRQDITNSHQKAMNLAVEANYFTKESTEIMISKASQEAINLAIEAGIYTKETIEQQVSKTNAEAQGLLAELKKEGYE